MKILFTLLIVMTASLSFAQNSNASFTYLDVTPKTEKHNICMSWSAGDDLNATWEVQATTNGKTYKTIGFVWGTTESMKGMCEYKQMTKTLSSKYKKYRVVKSVPVSETAKG